MQSPHSDSKKRRLESTTSQEFHTALRNFYKWLDYVELELSRSESTFDELGVDEKKVVYEDNLAGIESHKADYEKVLELGAKLVDELKQADKNVEEEEYKIAELTKCWDLMNERLRKIKEKVDFLTAIKQFRTELSSLQLVLDGYSKWAEENKESDQIEQFRVRKSKKISYFFN